MIDSTQLETWFIYHPPGPGQPQKYERLRSAAHDFARIVLDLTPSGHDQDRAVENIRAAIFWANASIACDGK